MKQQRGKKQYNKQVVEEEDSVDGNQNNNRTELTRVDVEMCKQNFLFYDKQKQGWVERFELPMVLNGKLTLEITIYSLWVQRE